MDLHRSKKAMQVLSHALAFTLPLYSKDWDYNI